MKWAAIPILVFVLMVSSVEGQIFPEFPFFAAEEQSLFEEATEDILFQELFLRDFIQTSNFNLLMAKNAIFHNLTVTNLTILLNQTIINETTYTGDIDLGGNDINNISLVNTTNLQANHYFTDQSNFQYNFYDDGSEMFFNFSDVTDAVNWETENSKMVLFNEPSSGNDFKVFQIFSKEAQDVTEFIIHKAGENRSAFSARSFRIGGETNSTCNGLLAGRFVDCTTDDTGADLVVQDEISTGGGAFFVNGTVNITDNAEVIASNFTGNSINITNVLYLPGNVWCFKDGGGGQSLLTSNC